MKSSTDFTPSANLAILLVGEPKSGKTNLTFAFPDPAILDCGGNMLSAVRRSPGKRFWYSQPFRDDDDKEVAEVDRWSRAMKETAKLLAVPDSRTFIIDDLSNLCRWGLVHCENELVKAGINIKKEYLAKYQNFIPLMTNFLTTIRMPKKLVVVTVHQTVDKEELTGRNIYKLDIPGRLADTLGGQFTDLWAMTSSPDPMNVKTQTKYEIRTKPTGQHVNLGTSLDLAPTINVTDLSPQQIWSLLEPKLSYNVKTTTS